MNRQLEILHKIFVLELNPPFELKILSFLDGHYDYTIYNKFSEKVGLYHRESGNLVVVLRFVGIHQKIKQVFNADNVSNEDIYNVTKHLFNWLQDKFPKDFTLIEVWNHDTNQCVRYPNND